MPTKFPIVSLPGLPEARMTIVTQFLLPVPVLQTRETTVHAFLQIQPPENADEAYWQTVRECLAMAIVGATLTGIFAGGVTALPTFMQIFGAKAASRGLELVANHFQVVTETTYGAWR